MSGLRNIRLPGEDPFLGGVLLATAGIAALSASVAARLALSAPPMLAVAVGLAWGLVILAIDRALVAGMTNRSTLAQTLVSAVPRLFLALIVGAVISTPLTLQIFHREIDTEIRAAQVVAMPALERRESDAPAEVRSGDGSSFLLRVNVLDRLGTRDPMLRWAHVLLWMTFTCIGMMPILVKLLMNVDDTANADER